MNKSSAYPRTRTRGRVLRRFILTLLLNAALLLATAVPVAAGGGVLREITLEVSHPAVGTPRRQLALAGDLVPGVRGDQEVAPAPAPGPDRLALLPEEPHREAGAQQREELLAP